ncbi:MAG TPA: DUF2189 domain-containing protein [Hyphomicrobiaceae bacterium]|nr:DUF2189 domain-containing protein [Hyphomicrobiaceae bacterium]
MSQAAIPRSALSIRAVPFDAPWGWLAAGWNDLWRVPHISLAYGAIFAIVAGGLLVGLTLARWQSLVPVLAGGFMLVGPLLAVGLYETSRRLEAGMAIELGDVIGAGLRAKGQLGFFGVGLMVIFLVWLELAFILLVLFLGGAGLPPPSEFVATLLFTPAGLGLLIVGSLVGGVLAATVYAVSVIAVPLLLVHRIDAISAVATSLAAVRQNPKPMLLWAGLIGGFMALGCATLFLGLVIIFPLVGHATWHAFRALVAVHEEDARVAII